MPNLKMYFLIDEMAVISTQQIAGLQANLKTSMAN